MDSDSLRKLRHELSRGTRLVDASVVIEIIDAILPPTGNLTPAEIHARMEGQSGSTENEMAG